MVVKNISELTPVRQRGIIINHNTKSFTLLSLLSALRYAKIPILLIDCSTDDSFEYFKCKMDQYEFDLLQAPLKVHGVTLDWIFSEIKDEQLILIDSDVEILNDELFLFFDKYSNHPGIFGAGFVHGHDFLRDGFKETDFYNALFFERPFIPVVMFKTSFIKEALSNNISFAAVLEDNQFTQFPSKLKWLKKFIKPHYLFRRRVYTYYPEKIWYDTGAKMYEYLRYKKLFFFTHLPHMLHRNYVKHFLGATRTIVDSKGTPDEAYVIKRLKEEYNELKTPLAKR
jgi:hypothetical protein